MPSRLSLGLSVCAGLFVTVAAAACTTNVVQREIVPAPASTDEAGTDPNQQMPGPDGGNEPDTSTGFVFKAAPDGTFAQGVSGGGSTVKTPKLVPIVYSSDPSKDAITAFSAKMATTTYWSAVASEYGVGALVTKPTITLTEAAPTQIDDSQIGNWLSQKFQSDPTHFGTPDSNTLYAIYYPPNTKVTEGGGTGCDSFGGYHYETTIGSTKVSYAVIPRCPTFGGYAGDDVITFAASHEILEWATDPFPQSRPAYEFVDDDHAVWGKVFLSELGDLCTQMGDVSAEPADLGFLVQRTWSNKSAAAGHHPCAPVSTKVPYFTAFPAHLDPINVTDQFGRNITTQGLKVGVGQKKTIDLTMYSDGAITPWMIQVVDLSSLTGSTEEFTYQLDKTKGGPGDTIHLTITGSQPAEQGQGFLIVSQHGNDLNLFPVWVIN